MKRREASFVGNTTSNLKWWNDFMNRGMIPEERK